ncbi:hypothetical protein D047_3475A, partial [Vibrio parahaemolyticus VPTS-2010_2]
MERRFGLID